MKDLITGTVPTHYGQLFYHRTGGDRLPLVLAHGLTDNGLCWRRTVKALISDFDIVMFDAAGHGQSSMLPEGVMADPAADVASLITALQLEAPIVMGHSIGAQTMLSFASAHPHIPSKVVLEDPLFKPAPTNKEKRQAVFREQVLATQKLEITDIIELGLKQHPNWHADDFPDWAEAKQQVNPRITEHHHFPVWQELIKAIQAPTLVIYGAPGNGGIVTAETAEEATSINPRITSTSIADAGHNIRRENFDDYIDAVRRFLLAP